MSDLFMEFDEFLEMSVRPLVARNAYLKSQILYSSNSYLKLFEKN